MIITMNLNPYLEKCVALHQLKPGERNRIDLIKRVAAGQGLSVALAAKHLGGEPFCMGFNYTENGRLITAVLEKSGILYDLVTVPGTLRTNLKLLDRSTEITTELYEPGGFVTEEAVEDLKFRLRRRAVRGTVAALSGSAPKGVGDDIYQRLIQELKLVGIPVILDAKGELLKKGLAASPWMIRMDQEEMERLQGRQYSSEKELLHDAKEMADQTASLIWISQEGGKALVVSREKNYRITPGQRIPKGKVENVGDATVAGVCVAVDKQADLHEILSSGAAATAAALTKGGVRNCTRLELERWIPQVMVERLNVEE